MRLKPIIASALAAAACIAAVAQDFEVLDLETKGSKTAPVQPTMYGLFFEDINYAADGGLYAEMVKNRSFEFPQRLAGWTAFGNVSLRSDGPFGRNPHYVRLGDSGHREKHTGLDNEGFFGIATRRDSTYRFSVWARVPDGGRARLRVEIIDPAADRQVAASKELEVDSPDWRRYEVSLKSSADISKGKLRIFLCHPDVTVDLEHISLFPADTWRGRDNGLRTDLAQALADLRPGVLRFPGGCIVEGTDPATRYRWQNTVGPAENRPLNENRWHYTFPHRFYPDYYQSGGLGFFEFFQLAEDIGAEPLPIVNVGLVCQYQNDLSDQIPLDSLQTYIDDAMQLIEFANGPADSPWGAVRVEMGHPEPFGMKYLGVGNEQWGPEYVERLEPFVKALRAAHPEIKIVGSSGPDSEGDKFGYLWPEMRRLRADLVDEHFYRPEDWFLSQGARYDSYDRKGPKVFAGEYACHGRGKNWNHFNAALMEAAFMTGLERNADVVNMATYAPLFAHAEGWQWRPDMIWFDNTRSARTASYLVQQLYSLNKGTHTARLTMDRKPVTGAEGQNGLFASAVYDEPSGSYIVKVANTSDEHRLIRINAGKLKNGKAFGRVQIQQLECDDPDADNTLDNPERIKVREWGFDNQGGNWAGTALAPRSFAVIHLLPL